MKDKLVKVVRKWKKLSIICYLSFFIFHLSLFAETSAAPFTYLNKSAALAGMGSLDTIFAKHPTPSGNPALYGINVIPQISFSGGEDANSASLGRLSFNTRIKKTGFGISYFNYDINFKYINFGGYQTGSDISYTGEMTSLASGFRLYKNFYGGISYENVSEKVDTAVSNKLSDSASSINIGLLLKLGEFNIGFLQKNVNGGKLWDREISAPGKVSFGLEMSDYRIALSFNSDREEDYMALGLEWDLAKWFSIRTGVEVSLNDDTDPLPGFGFGINIGFFGFDFASVQHPDLGNTTFAGIKYSWGRQKKEKTAALLPLEEPAVSPPPELIEKRIERRQLVTPAQAPEKAAPVELPQVAPGEKINIAVSDFEARPPLSQSDAAFISDFFRSDFVKEAKFNVIEKKNMDKILAEQGFQQMGCTTAECAVQMGKILNVKLMIVGSCGQLLGKYVITMNVVNVESAKIIYSDDIQVADPAALRDSIRGLVEKFGRSVK